MNINGNVSSVLLITFISYPAIESVKKQGNKIIYILTDYISVA